MSGFCAFPQLYCLIAFLPLTTLAPWLLEFSLPHTSAFNFCIWNNNYMILISSRDLFPFQNVIHNIVPVELYKFFKAIYSRASKWSLKRPVIFSCTWISSYKMVKGLLWTPPKTKLIIQTFFAVGMPEMLTSHIAPVYFSQEASQK